MVLIVNIFQALANIFPKVIDFSRTVHDRKIFCYNSNISELNLVNMVLIVKISQASAYEVWGSMCMLPDTLRTSETCYHIIKM